jgi:hydrogenase maturation protease
MIHLIGIGQRLRGDDEAGLAAVSLWCEMFSSVISDNKLKVELAESPGIGLLDLLSGADSAILVDGVESGADPGTIHKISESDLVAFLPGSETAHGWGVAETIALGKLTNPHLLPEKIILIGIEIRQVELGTEMSPVVKAVLPEAVNLIQEMIDRLCME